MSDALHDMAGEQSAVLVTPSPETAGALLRAARERAGLHVAALAVAIKIPVKKLEALESDQLLATHDIVFTRALASSVCRALKIDPKPILDALPQSTVKELHVDDNGINAPFAPGAQSVSPSLWGGLRQPWAMLVMALVAGALVMLAMGWGEGREVTATSSAPVVAEEPIAQQPVAPQVTAPMVIPPETEVAKPTSNEQVAQAPLGEGKGGAEPAPAAVQVAAVSGKEVLMMQVSATGAASPATAAGTERVMSFRAKQQPVWVEVVDARGDVRLRRTVGAGEKVECAGVLPLTVVLGRADAVEVEVRGKPFNFAPFVRENVARFEVK